MTNDHGACHFQNVQTFRNQVGLLLGCPGTPARPCTMAEPRPVHGNGARMRCTAVEEAAEDEIFRRASVSMQEEHGSAPTACFDVMQPHATYCYELSSWRSGAFG